MLCGGGGGRGCAWNRVRDAFRSTGTEAVGQQARSAWRTHKRTSSAAEVAGESMDADAREVLRVVEAGTDEGARAGR
jgi:hypothetical protein